jgi:hypothetical protein
MYTILSLSALCEAVKARVLKKFWVKGRSDATTF